MAILREPGRLRVLHNALLQKTRAARRIAFPGRKTIEGEF
jgi:hypothetical protein